MKKIVAVAVTLLLCASVASAATNLGKYEKWADSPMGYFMTKSERQQWKALTSEAEAEKFVAEFKSKRNANFETEVNKRAAMADQHLSVGKIKGSSILSGKLVILFGPPIDIKVADRKGKTSFAPPPSGAATTNLGGGMQSGDGEQTAMGSGREGAMFRDYTFTFSGKNAPGLGKDQFTAIVAVDTGVGKAKLKDESKQAELDAAIDAVAEGSIKK